eukprot:CAMPEP_0170110306 /NCGR_PEP_ID=MMETSP0020_2-20130122/7770_1 /TAXON_ID=98059 /ORGANISM="Dinobryon sp., Strain UTEXLB2267" /LENGTH=175 /DNA_ID=CAMNT_0010335557 /DNA_START=417 /DNA_END=944 /DNA_ORIENTATION=-
MPDKQSDEQGSYHNGLRCRRTMREVENIVSTQDGAPVCGWRRDVLKATTAADASVCAAPAMAKKLLPSSQLAVACIPAHPHPSAPAAETPPASASVPSDTTTSRWTSRPWPCAQVPTTSAVAPTALTEVGAMQQPEVLTFPSMTLYPIQQKVPPSRPHYHQLRVLNQTSLRRECD